MANANKTPKPGIRLPWYAYLFIVMIYISPFIMLTPLGLITELFTMDEFGIIFANPVINIITVLTVASALAMVFWERKFLAEYKDKETVRIFTDRGAFILHPKNGVFGFVPYQEPVVGHVDSDTNEKRAGLKSGDVITQVNGKKVTNMMDLLEAAYLSDYINMYAMYKYLKAAKKALDEEQLRAYLDLVERYQNSSYNKDVHVTTNDGLVINQDVILSLIASLKKRLESKDRLAGWVLLPPGKKQKKDSDEDSSGQRTLGTFREPEDRKGFYEGTGYIARIVGIEQNEGYTAYVYPNGEVILDNTKKNENGRHAIYHIKAVNFELLSRLDKTTLRSLPEVERIIHNKNWQERVKGIIQEEGTESDQAAAAELHSKLKRG